MSAPEGAIKANSAKIRMSHMFLSCLVWGDKAHRGPL